MDLALAVSVASLASALGVLVLHGGVDAGSIVGLVAMGLLSLGSLAGLALNGAAIAVGFLLLVHSLVLLAGYGYAGLRGIASGLQAGLVCLCLLVGWFGLDWTGSVLLAWLDVDGSTGFVGSSVSGVVLVVKPLGEFFVTTSCIPS